MFKILIVEQYIVFRQTLKEIVCRQFPSMLIKEASSIRDALKKVHTFCPDLIFIGTKLSGGNGFELVNKIRNHSTTTIVMIIPFDTPECHKAVLDCGANYRISKSTSTRKEIMNMVESILSDRG